MATPFIDSFDGAGATTDLAAWTPTGGTAWARQDGVASGVTVRTTGSIHPGSTTPTSYICDDQGSTSQYVIVQGPTTATAAINASVSCVRLVDASNFIGVSFVGTGTTGLRLRTVIAGTTTSLIEAQFTASEWIKVEVDGASGAAKVRLYGGGTGSSPGTWTQIGTEQTVTDSVFNGETSCGVRSANSSSGAGFAGYFEAGALGGAALPTLSLPTAVNITATSFQPRVTYAY